MNMDNAKKALTLMYDFASTMAEKHGMNGDDTMTDAEHEQWREAAAWASNVLMEWPA